jgi:GNAT superfamily N-acetyltransferase
MLIRRLEQSSRDVTDLLRLLMDMHGASKLALPPVDMGKVLKGIWECDSTGVIFVAEQDGSIVGAIGLVLAEPWFSSETLLYDKFFYVKREHRASNAGDDLLSAAKKYASILGKPLNINHWFGEDIDRKDVYFRRKGFQRAGGIYVLGLEKGEAT